VQTAPSQNTFQVNAGYEIRRWDDLGLPGGTTSIPVVFNYTLTDSGGNSVPLVNNSQTFYDAVSNYVPVILFFPFVHTVDYPNLQAGAHTLDIQPSVQLDSVNKTYYLTVTLSHTNNPTAQQVLAANTLTTPLNELLHFNGNLFFGAIGTTMNAVGIPDPPANPPSGGFVPTTLSGAGGFATGKTDHTFAGGLLNVNLNPAGDAFVTAGSVTLSGPSPDTDNLAGVSFQRGPVTLSPSGASADITVTLPNGFGYRLNDTNSLVLTAFLPFTGVALSGPLLPTTDLTYLAATGIYAAEENKPVWLVTDRIIWHVNTGQFDLPPTGPGAIYVRALDYAYLQSVSNNLVDPPNMCDKRSNDKYWLSLNAPTQTPTISPDSQGNALLTTAFAFGSGGFRSHFPYDTAITWSGAGALKVVSDLVVTGPSYLSGANQVGVTFTRDCPDCGGGGSGTVTPTITVTNNQFNVKAVYPPCPDAEAWRRFVWCGRAWRIHCC
jgi:hypothetical protein